MFIMNIIKGFMFYIYIYIYIYIYKERERVNKYYYDISSYLN
jgi:hypothetical protein